jgi:hypothetical protein
MLIEVTTFQSAEGTADAALLEADRVVQAELSSMEGFVRRTTARGDDGGWLVITLWRTPGDADRLRQAPSPGLQELDELVDTSSQATVRYFTRD